MLKVEKTEKEKQREKIDADVRAFQKKGGAIQEVDHTANRAALVKPVTHYGSSKSRAKNSFNIKAPALAPTS